MAREDLYSKKGTNKFVKQADGSIYGFSENGLQFLTCGSQVTQTLLSDLDPADRAKLESNGEVTVDKQN